MAQAVPIFENIARLNRTARVQRTLCPTVNVPFAFIIFLRVWFLLKTSGAPERIRHTPLVAAKYNRQNRTENPLEMGGEGGDGAAWGELGDRGGNEGATWTFSKEEFYTGRAPSAKG